MRHEQLHQFGHILGTREKLVSMLLILNVFVGCPEGDLNPQGGKRPSPSQLKRFDLSVASPATGAIQCGAIGEKASALESPLLLECRCQPRT